jgi:serine/threonine protein kinase
MLIAQRFCVLETAGSGGMGTVYRAEDLLTGATIALKLLHDTKLGSTAVERFHREAQVLSELRHPGIVSYVAHGITDEGRPYLAMEWLDGEDLGQRFARQGLTPQESLTLIRGAAQALAVAHRRGIVHRDLKPSKVSAV